MVEIIKDREKLKERLNKLAVTLCELKLSMNPMCYSMAMPVEDLEDGDESGGGDEKGGGGSGEESDSVSDIVSGSGEKSDGGSGDEG